MRDYVGRLAPSPTGALHLGNVRTFMIAWLRARSQGGKVIFRMEDLDHPKDKPGAAAQAIEDLRWLGFDWDEEYVQSERKAIYAEATQALFKAGHIYPCVCSRKDVESAQSAPHSGDQLFYPGTCRDRFSSWQSAVSAKLANLSTASSSSACRKPLIANSQQLTANQQPCWRFKVPSDCTVSFTDVFAGPYTQNISTTLGDFPLARDEGGAGYTLAATLDDLLMGVTEVVRGDDLLPATPAQILLSETLTSVLPLPLSTTTIAYCHVPLVVGPDGRRLAKRHGDTRISFYREQGRSPESILGYLAASCGWCAPGDSISLAALLPRFTLATIPRSPFVAASTLNANILEPTANSQQPTANS